MRYLLLVALICVPLSVGSAQGRFVGNLEFMPAGCEAQRACKLKYAFGFIDGKGIGWEALSGPNGLQTDGATIPDWARPHIGEPFDNSYIRAAVIHDHYCWRHVRPWRDTHRVFYEALLVSGVPKAKTLLMYYAVYWKGPRWVQLIPGRACPTGRNCLHEVPSALRVSDTHQITGESGARFLVRAARYNAPELALELRTVARLIDERGGNISLKELETRAEAKEPADFFSLRPDTLLIAPSVGVDR